jgi:hypothetical protein
LDEFLVCRGFNPTGDWWLAQLERYWRSGKFIFVGRVGRRGGKSTMACRTGVTIALWGHWKIPPGETAKVIYISLDRREASDRIDTIKAILTALGEPFEPRNGEIWLKRRAVVFIVLVATIGGVSGKTAIAAFCDEAAKWRDKHTGANPASEVFASLKPSMLTMRPCAFLFLISSPFSTVDAHYREFEEGETRQKVVAEAPTWIANPSRTEEDTREMEADQRVWRREYAAIPQAAAGSVFDGDAVERMFRPRAYLGSRRSASALLLDPSSGKKDTWAWCVAWWETPLLADGSPRPSVFTVRGIDGVEGHFFDHGDARDVVARAAEAGRLLGAEVAHSDQREELALKAMFANEGLGFYSHPWTQPTKIQAIERLRRLAADNRISIEPHEKMKRELLAFEEKATPNGSFTYAGRGGEHDDYVALLVTGMMALGELGETNVHNDMQAAADAAVYFEHHALEYSRWGADDSMGF